MNTNIKDYISTYHRRNHVYSRDLQDGFNNVKDKTFAPVQITVEQILKETYSGYAENKKLQNSRDERNEFHEFRDSDELDEYRIRRRKEFEDIIRKKRWKISLYLSYAKWEALQNNLNNSRSIFERALNINYEHNRIWREYINMEIINGNINNARNLYERVTKLLPMVDEFWIKYVQMEQILKNYINVRHIFNSWIKWKPDKNIYLKYCKFEEECGEIELARGILNDLISSHPTQEAYLFLAKFELKYNIASLRSVFDQIICFFKSSDTQIDPKIFVFFAEVFVNQKKLDEAIDIYNQGILLTEAQDRQFLKEKLFNVYKLEKKQRIDDTDEWKSNKINQYRDNLFLNPVDFDKWFDFSIFAFQYLKPEDVRKVFDDFSKVSPPTDNIIEFEKYIYSCFLYLCYFETNINSSSAIIDKTLRSLINKIDNFKEINKKDKKCESKNSNIKSINSSFSEEDSQILSEVFIFFSGNQIRNCNLPSARKILGAGLGRIPCPRLFDYYINFELKLGNFDRCRLLFTKYVEYNPVSADTWKKYMKFEYQLGEIKRFIGIAEAGISMPELDSPEKIWEYYIEIMIEKGNYEATDNIYRRLLEKTQHHQVVMDYSTFIVYKLNEIEYNREFILGILNSYKQNSMEYRRMLILKYWLSLEEKLNKTGYTNNCEKWIKIIKKLTPDIIVDKTSNEEHYIFNEENYEISYLLNSEVTEITDKKNKGFRSSVPSGLIDAAKSWKKLKL
ncbi:hypothetical protein FG386_000013 [Cryptosporidium ryanae]|uniref:uncharacterized protein n=1 Tax=Cryptosporidium ryanae TaxID=515981 RepID=UPI00351A696D|nr:hypothetical protein FG386_000013 [Cryptosporidium ryanae]